MEEMDILSSMPFSLLFLWEQAGPQKARALGCPPQAVSFAKGFCPRELAVIQWSSVLGDLLVYRITSVSSLSTLSVIVLPEWPYVIVLFLNWFSTQW